MTIKETINQINEKAIQDIENVLKSEMPLFSKLNTISGLISLHDKNYSEAISSHVYSLNKD